MDKTNKAENLSLFDAVPNEQLTLDHTAGPLDVVRAEFAGAETLSWEELFEGYDISAC